MWKDERQGLSGVRIQHLPFRRAEEHLHKNGSATSDPGIGRCGIDNTNSHYSAEAYKKLAPPPGLQKVRFCSHCHSWRDWRGNVKARVKFSRLPLTKTP